jgi:hypothetical protein
MATTIVAIADGLFLERHNLFVKNIHPFKTYLHKNNAVPVLIILESIVNIL